MAYEVKCEFCGKPVDAELRETWHRVEGWERPGKSGGSDIALRKRTGEGFAHPMCVRREQEGLPSLRQDTLDLTSAP
jgi:hypothetical protein